MIGWRDIPARKKFSLEMHQFWFTSRLHPMRRRRHQQQEPHRGYKQRAHVIVFASGGPPSNHVEHSLMGCPRKILQWFTKELMRAYALQWPSETGSRSIEKIAGRQLAILLTSWIWRMNIKGRNECILYVVQLVALPWGCHLLRWGQQRGEEQTGKHNDYSFGPTKGEVSMRQVGRSA